MQLISDTQNMFNQTFGFTVHRVELWGTSFFVESGGVLFSEMKMDESTDNNRFMEFVRKEFKDKLMLKLVGRMRTPAECNAFVNFFLKSEDRWRMPHIFFDTQIGEDDLLDVLWKTDSRKEYATALLDEVSHMQVDIA
jgi:hypothetical protein